MIGRTGLPAAQDPNAVSVRSRPKLLFAEEATTTITKVYTVPADTYVEITQITLVDFARKRKEASVWLVPAGQSPEDRFKIMSSVEVDKNDSLILNNIGYGMEAGDMVYIAASSNDDLTVRMDGEVSAV
jgi:hypothetical protein